MFDATFTPSFLPMSFTTPFIGSCRSAAAKFCGTAAPPLGASVSRRGAYLIPYAPTSELPRTTPTSGALPSFVQYE
jgi:hypothetical protein